MKTKPHLLIVAALALGGSAVAALAQDNNPKPAPAPAAPANPAPPAGSPPPPPPAPPEGGHHEGHHGEWGHRFEGGPQPEGGHHFEGGPQGPGGHHFEGGPGPGPQAQGGHHPGFGPGHGPQLPPKPTAYIGVVTTPLPPVLTAQLGLNEGFGLIVGEVLPDSPAAKAGLQKFDVITKFNDQLLVDAGQFAALVRASGKDTDATLTFLRKAKEQTAAVKIGERLLPVHPPGQMHPPGPQGGDFRREFDHSRGQRPGGPGEFRGEFRGEPGRGPARPGDFQNRMREFHERFRAWQQKPHAENSPEAMPQPPTLDPQEILQQVKPGGVADLEFVQPNGTVTYRTADAKVTVKDDSGEITLSSKDGVRQLLAKDAKGETVFDGPIDTEEQFQTLPEDVRNKVDLIEARITIAQADLPTQGEEFQGPDSESESEPDVQ